MLNFTWPQGQVYQKQKGADGHPLGTTTGARTVLFTRTPGAAAELGGSRFGLAVIFDVRLGRFRSVVHCVFVVTAR
jgi:hypothetical protein